MRLSEALSFGAGQISRRDAVYVLKSVTGHAREDIIIQGDTILCKNHISEYTQKIERLTNGEPLQYVLGKWDFCGIEFIVDKRALIPRPETELLVETVVDHIKVKQWLDVLDVCAGGGCIGLSIAKFTGFGHNIVLADISEQALSLAKENFLRLFARGRINLIQSDLLDDIPGEFDIIVSNPPYIPSKEMDSLPENVKNFEPHLALNGGPDGLDIYRKLIPQSFAKLKPGGMIFLEIGPAQAMEIMQKSGFKDTKIQKDYSGIDRILQGVKCHV